MEGQAAQRIKQSTLSIAIISLDCRQSDLNHSSQLNIFSDSSEMMIIVDEPEWILVPVCGTSLGFRHPGPLGLQQYVWQLVPPSGTNNYEGAEVESYTNVRARTYKRL